MFRWFICMMLGLLLSACPRKSEEPVPDGGAGTSCSITSQCGDNLICAAGTCQFEGSIAAGSACWANRDCAAGLFCSASGVCEPAGAGQEGELCATSADCAKTLACELVGAGGVCALAGAGDVGASCTQTTDCLAGLGCTDRGMCQPLTEVVTAGADIECQDDSAPFRVYFQVPRPEAPLPDFFRLPYPNDIRVRPDGTLDLTDLPRAGQSLLGQDITDIWANALSAEFAGFSPVTSVRFRFSGAFGGDLGPGGAYFHYIDITPGVPQYGLERQRRYGYVADRSRYACQHSLLIRNEAHEPLLPGHTYAVYLTTDIRSSENQAPVVEPDFAALMNTERPAGDQELGRAWDAYAPFRAYLAQAGIAPETIAAAAVFTVSDTTDRAARLAAQVATTPLPVLSDVVLCDDSVTSPCGEAERGCKAADAAFHEIHGRFRVPSFQQGVAPFERDGGEITELGGVFQQNGNIDVCFALLVPKVPAGQEPASWPLVIYGHGVGGQFTEVRQNGVGHALAQIAQPAAVLSFEAVLHGQRRGDSAVHPLHLFHNLRNPRATRDSRLQAVVDLLQAARIPQAGPITVPNLAAPVALDAQRTYYFGHGLGADTGILAGAVSNRLQAMVLAGAGTNVSGQLLERQSPIRTGVAVGQLVGEALDPHHPFTLLWQTYLDSVDPVSYAPLWYRRPLAGISAKHALLVWGADDRVTPPALQSTTVRALGLAMALPVIEDLGLATAARPVTPNRSTPDGNRLAVAAQYAPQSGTEPGDGHLVAFTTAVTDWSAFLASLIDTGTPVLP